MARDGVHEDVPCPVCGHGARPAVASAMWLVLLPLVTVLALPLLVRLTVGAEFSGALLVLLLTALVMCVIGLSKAHAGYEDTPAEHVAERVLLGALVGVAVVTAGLLLATVVFEVYLYEPVEEGESYFPPLDDPPADLPEELGGLDPTLPGESVPSPR